MQPKLCELQMLYKSNPKNETHNNKNIYCKKYRKSVRDIKIETNSQFILKTKNKSRASQRIITKNKKGTKRYFSTQLL